MCTFKLTHTHTHTTYLAKEGSKSAGQSSGKDTRTEESNILQSDCSHTDHIKYDPVNWTVIEPEFPFMCFICSSEEILYN